MSVRALAAATSVPAGLFTLPIADGFVPGCAPTSSLCGASLLSGFLLPLSTLKTVSRDESLHDEHVSGVVALTAQAKLHCVKRTG